MLYGRGATAQAQFALTVLVFLLYGTTFPIVYRTIKECTDIILCFHLLCLDTSKGKGRKERGENLVHFNQDAGTVCLYSLRAMGARLAPILDQSVSYSVRRYGSNAVHKLVGQSGAPLSVLSVSCTAESAVVFSYCTVRFFR